MTHFMELPLELRILIYEYCFAFGKIFPYLKAQLKEERSLRKMQSEEKELGHPVFPDTAYLTMWTSHIMREQLRYPEPYVDLLRANKAIYEEAAPILYGKNIVVLPIAPLAAKFFHDCLGSVEKRLWLKNVELELSCADMSLEDKKDWSQSRYLNLPWHRYRSHRENWGFMGRDAELAKDLHYIWKRQLAEVIWPAKLVPILEHTKLKKLTVHILRSKCPMQCCTIHTRAIAAFGKGFANGMVPMLCLNGHHSTPFKPLGCKLPASANVDERDFAGMTLAAVSCESNGEAWLPNAVRMGEQIARWTRARELDKEEGYGDYRWFNTALQKDDKKEGSGRALVV